MKMFRSLFAFLTLSLMFSLAAYSSEDEQSSSEGNSLLFPGIFRAMLPESDQFIISKDLTFFTEYVRPDGKSVLRLQFKFESMAKKKQRLDYHSEKIPSDLISTDYHTSLVSIFELLLDSWAKQLGIKGGYFTLKAKAEKTTMLLNVYSALNFKQYKKFADVKEEVREQAALAKSLLKESREVSKFQDDLWTILKDSEYTEDLALKIHFEYKILVPKGGDFSIVIDCLPVEITQDAKKREGEISYAKKEMNHFLKIADFLQSVHDEYERFLQHTLESVLTEKDCNFDTRSRMNL